MSTHEYVLITSRRVPVFQNILIVRKIPVMYEEKDMIVFDNPSDA